MTCANNKILILVLLQPENHRQMIIHERTLKDVLTPAYHWLFVIMGRLEHGVKFLVDLRTDVLVSKLIDFYRIDVFY